MAIQHPTLEQLSQLTDGEISAPEPRTLNDRLFACANCKATFESFRALDLELRRAPLVGCEAALALISARLDEEADEAEAAVAERHLETCATCRADARTWSTVSAALAALPAGSPAARVDGAIAAVARRERRPVARPVPAIAARTLVTVTAAIAVVAVALSPVAPTAVPVATQIGTQPDQVIVAAAQSVVLNERTNTLYVLDAANAAVEARDATTSELKAKIEVGGKPTALALNSNTNTVLVLDASQKKVTEIDGAKNSVVSSASVPVNGTLTSINVEPNGGKILVTTAESGSSTGASGAVVVLDQNTKQVEALRDLAVTPEILIDDPEGHRAALVSTNQTTLLDTSYKVIGTLPGGIAAAFDRGERDWIAILGATSTGSIVAFGGAAAPLSLQLAGSPRAITSLA